MTIWAKPPGYYADCNEALLRAVPASARHILEVGCAGGQFCARLKEEDTGRVVYGVEREPEVAARAAGRLDRVFCLDVAAADPPLEGGSLDCILYGPVLVDLPDPGATLARQRRLLRPGGCILCSVPNVRHAALFAAVLRGDFVYTEVGLLGATGLHYGTCPTFFRLLREAGFAPSLLAATRVECPTLLLGALLPLLRYLGLHAGRTRQQLSACQYLFRGDPLPCAPVARPAVPGAGRCRRVPSSCLRS